MRLAGIGAVGIPGAVIRKTGDRAEPVRGAVCGCTGRGRTVSAAFGRCCTPQAFIRSRSMDDCGG